MKVICSKRVVYNRDHVGSLLAIMLKIPIFSRDHDGATGIETRSDFFPPHADETKASSGCSVVTQRRDTLPEPASAI